MASAPLPGPAVRRGFVDGRHGQLHYAECGDGPDDVLMLHQTPRSWDEYRDVLPILGVSRRAIAMDMVGFGDSVKPEAEQTIEECAASAADLLDALGLTEVAVVGHHTGGTVAVELAASRPDLVRLLVLSSTGLVDEVARARAVGRPPIDEVEVREDGSHLTELWQRRIGFYPKGRPDLLHRFCIDAMKVLDRVEEGHHAVHRYRMEDRLPLLRVPVLLLVGTEDPYVYPKHQRLVDAIPGSEVRELVGGMVPMVDQMPEEFAAAVQEFLDRHV
jgi:pimeloyl-ACP methyl ester carboxylesterase